MATLCLQERLCELLAQPIANVDDLKKLTLICRQIREAKLDKVTKPDFGDDEGIGGGKLEQVLSMFARRSQANAASSTPSMM